MEITAEQKTTRQAPRKVRLVANSVRKLPLEQALRQLAMMEKRASLVVTKVIRQALANAKHNHRLEMTDVELKNILVNAGPVYKRWQAVSRGRAHSIAKRTSHVKVILVTKDEIKKALTKPEQKFSQPAPKTAKSAVPTKTKKAK
jgi:large subunit ribosomal protein L22